MCWVVKIVYDSEHVIKQQVTLVTILLFLKSAVPGRQYV